MSEMKTELAVRKQIARQLDDLIHAASEKVEKLAGSDMKENQIRNAVNVASASQSIEEVTNFIRYQIGRDTKNKTWSHAKFGASVIADIESGAVQSATDSVCGAVPEADRVRVRSELIALYLGYMNRYFTYKSSEWNVANSSPRQERRR